MRERGREGEGRSGWIGSDGLVHSSMLTALFHVNAQLPSKHDTAPSLLPSFLPSSPCHSCAVDHVLLPPSSLCVPGPARRDRRRRRRGGGRGCSRPGRPRTARHAVRVCKLKEWQVIDWCGMNERGSGEAGWEWEWEWGIGIVCATLVYADHWARGVTLGSMVPLGMMVIKSYLSTRSAREK